MSRASILAAAAALRQFTAGQLAAYCDEDETAVAAFLTRHPGWWEWLADTGEWRVVDLAGLRAELAAARQPGRTSAPAPRPETPAEAAERLLLAEEMLLSCAEERRADRRTIADTALNHLRQFIAAVRPATGPSTKPATESSTGPAWWAIDLAGRLVVPDVPLGPADLVTAGRVRIDIALARLTMAEAARRPASADELIDLIGIAWDVECLPDAMSRERRRSLDEAFTALCGQVVGRPAGPDRDSAPAAFLATLARLRAPDRAEHSSASARVLVRLLDSVARAATAVTDSAPATPLFRVLDRSPDGQRRVAVYSGLLPLVPHGCRWHREAELLPGVVVEAVTDDRASRHLEDSARTLARGLTGFREPSRSALLGQAAYVLEEVASQRASLDREVVSRSETTRKELLSFGGVLV